MYVIKRNTGRLANEAFMSNPMGFKNSGLKITNCNEKRFSVAAISPFTFRHRQDRILDISSECQKYYVNN